MSVVISVPRDVQATSGTSSENSFAMSYEMYQIQVKTPCTTQSSARSGIDLNILGQWDKDYSLHYFRNEPKLDNAAYKSMLQKNKK